MHNYLPWKPLVAFIIGLAVGGTSTFFMLTERADDGHFHTHNGEETGAFHVHADFLMIVDDARVDLTADKYMSAGAKELHPNVHFHNNKDDIIHFHAPNISLVEFLTSIGITVTSECLTVHSETRCTKEGKALRLYVNGEDKTTDITQYLPQDNDRILLYYGEPTSTLIQSYQDQITDRACIYTGTCPERGTAPPEECGLTCEL